MSIHLAGQAPWHCFDRRAAPLTGLGPGDMLTIPIRGQGQTPVKAAADVN